MRSVDSRHGSQNQSLDLGWASYSRLNSRSCFGSTPCCEQRSAKVCNPCFSLFCKAKSKMFAVITIQEFASDVSGAGVIAPGYNFAAQLIETFKIFIS